MKLFKSFLSLVVVCFFTQIALADDTNFACDIFTGVHGDASGSLTLKGSDYFVQEFNLLISEGKLKPRAINGSLYTQGLVPFTDLPSDVQSRLIGVLNMSRRGLKAGSLVLFTNTKDPKLSTLNVFLMPSGEIAYITVGALEVLCMQYNIADDHHIAHRPTFLTAPLIRWRYLLIGNEDGAEKRDLVLRRLR